MAKIKFYVVWVGRQPGVYYTWDDCKAQTHGFPKAVYKSFETLVEAQKALASDNKVFIGKNGKQMTTLTPEQRLLIGEPIKESISVDAAWNTISKVVEYQAVFTKNQLPVFKMGPFQDGTINMGEFLAIVHALAHCKKHNITLPIYSDSKIALKWVREKETSTFHSRSKRNTEIFGLFDRALVWLKNNEYTNEILKWETKAWGENPADFGRK